MYTVILSIYTVFALYKQTSFLNFIYLALLILLSSFFTPTTDQLAMRIVNTSLYGDN